MYSSQQLLDTGDKSLNVRQEYNINIGKISLTKISLTKRKITAQFFNVFNVLTLIYIFYN